MIRSHSSTVQSALKTTPPRISALALALLVSGCWEARDDGPPPPKPAPSVHEIIGGFTANNSALNAVGNVSLRTIDAWSGEAYFEQLCTASLIDADTALTAKHCLDSIIYYVGYGYELVFTIGPSAYAPADFSEIIAFEGAPGSVGGFNGYGHDVAVLQLATPFEGVPALQLGTLSDTDIGQDFAAVGFGARDNSGIDGNRRVGSVELRARSGRTYELMLGSFAAFYEWYTGTPLPPECENAGSGTDDGDAGVIATDGGFVDCYYVDYVRTIFETVLLEELGEVFAGGTPGDAQPCYGDSGSPLIRSTGTGLVVYGVVSGGLSSPTQICDYGAVYATFDAGTLAFLEQAKSWVDPCKGLAREGVCEGSVANRCSTVIEGKRRRLTFDCATVGLSCQTQNDGSLGCGEDDASFGPPPPIEITPDVVISTPSELQAAAFKRPQD